MRHPLMRPLEQRHQVLLKHLVILRAAQQAVLAEFRPGDAAMLAGRADFLLQSRVLHDEIGQQLVDRHVALHRQPFVLGGTLLAKMFLDFLPAFDFGEMDRGGFIAVVALHLLACFLQVGKLGRSQ